MSRNDTVPALGLFQALGLSLSRALSQDLSFFLSLARDYSFLLLSVSIFFLSSPFPSRLSRPQAPSFAPLSYSFSLSLALALSLSSSRSLSSV